MFQSSEPTSSWIDQLFYYFHFAFASATTAIDAVAAYLFSTFSNAHWAARGGKERFWLSFPFKYLLTLFRFIVIIWSNLSAWRVKYDHWILLWYMNTRPEAFRAMWCERDTHTLSTHTKHFMFAQSNINNYVKYYTKSHKYPRLCSLSTTLVRGSLSTTKMWPLTFPLVII